MCAVETNTIRNHDVTDLILGLIQWVKDPALPQAAAQATDAAQI